MKSYSQNSEDTFILELFKGVKRQLHFIELGAGDGEHFSNCKLLKENGWNGISIDADNKGNNEVLQSFITRENIINLIDENHKGSTIDFLSIDLDGNDYWILKEILTYFDPCVICMEINSQLPNDEEMVINYNPDRSWDGSFAYGMNYEAALRLMDDFGYLVIRNCSNTNLIATRAIPDYEDFGQTYSHPEVLPEGSYFLNPNP